ncbi:protein translocase subunit SecDF [Mycoplasma leonicaptivi]|uniref:protein translocase subunit SecDF n=1 Tax=Mycoplasma leonicaptivi TaxID=36742 RepID=UPI00047F07C3|nr:hypothetical protein [Mycoplasma leonicaptivi]
MKIIRKFFILNNWKRLLISVFMVIATILSIIFGSVFYLSENNKKSIDYGSGIKVVVKAEQNNSSITDSDKTSEISNSLFQRLSGSSSISDVKVISHNNGTYEIIKNGDFDDKKQNQFIDEIINKPTFVFTDKNNNVLFENGRFVNNVSLDKNNWKKWLPPLSLSKPTEHISRNEFNGIKLNLSNDKGQAELAKLKEYYDKQNGKTILIWLNLDELINKAKNEYPKEWEKSKQNIWNFIHVNNEEFTLDKDNRRQANGIKNKELNIEDNFLLYTLSTNDLFSISEINFNKTYTNSKAAELTNKINFAFADYDLSVVSISNINSSEGNKKWFYAMIATIVIFGILAFILLINYGLLGALTTISSALYIFITLILFTLMRGEYSPASITAILIGLAFITDSSISWFERLKRGVFEKDSLKKSYKNSSRKHFIDRFNINLLIFISSLVMFYFTFKDDKNFSILITISVLTIAISVTLILKLLSYLLINSDLINQNKLWLIGIKKIDFKNYENVKNLNKKINIYSIGKISLFILLGFITIGTITFITLSAINKNVWFAVSSDPSLSGGWNILITGNSDLNQKLSLDDVKNLQNEIINIKEFNFKNITYIDEISNTQNYLLRITSHKDLSSFISKITEIVKNYDSKINVVSYQLTNYDSNKSLLWISIGSLVVMFIASVITLFIFGWTYSLTLLIGFILDLLFAFSLLTITRFYVDNSIFIIFALLIIWSIYEKINFFNTIKITVKEVNHQQVIKFDDVKKLAALAVNKNLNRTISISTIIFLISIIMLGFNILGNLHVQAFMLLALIGIIILNTLITPFIWSFIEKQNQKLKQKRIDSGFWLINNPEEQTFNGINDYL